MTAHIEQALQRQDFDLAAKLYLEWYEATPSDFKITGSNPSRSQVTHIANAANLARRSGYQELQFVESVSSRMGGMVKALFGLVQPAFAEPLQRPNFLYIPSLASKPFYAVSEIDGLKEWIDLLSPFKNELLALGRTSKNKYVDEFETLPTLKEWDKLKDEWLSTHLIKGGEQSDAFNELSKALQNVLLNAPLAHCPPHAPEMFVSVLEPGAYIPPHYGISNCKLTVHIPLKVNEQASLKAGDDTFRWTKNDDAMVFDDSFLHSAKNDHNEVRIVLIFDVWHPELTIEEKQALAKFMRKFSDWNSGVGQLANLDAQLQRK
ncbi:hypothetical protein BM523_05005 [Alteromonas mediterranea]|nr:hypothetical protein BM523_05005 [Alteromonas mediterranea]APD97046.1 hypothetical protein BM525_05060 [Alteromonas mediterranea]QDG34158.1 aspartyl/asparaginyl beta-hydroxylase domain-containing protein [Alteromonas mediterranea]